MRNQLRAAFYLLSRSSYLKGAVAVTVLIAAFRIWVGLTAPADANVSFAQENSVFGRGVILGGFAPFVCCVVAAGMAGADRKTGAVRMACSTDQGRTQYATSRFVLVLIQTATICLLTMATGLLVWAVTGIPIDTLDYGSPWIALRLPSSILLVAVYAQVIQLFCWLARSTALSVLVAYVGVGFVWLFSLYLDQQAFFYPALAPLFEFIKLGTLFPSLKAVGAAGASDVLLLLVVPCACLALTYALGRLFWAKRAV